MKMHKLKIFVLDDVSEEQKWAIASLTLPHKDSSEYLEMEDKLALAGSLFDIYTERVAGHALRRLAELPNNGITGPVDLIISDINLTEIKDLPIEELEREATQTRGIEFAKTVSELYPKCQIALFTAYIEKLHRQLRLLQLNENVSVKNKAGDLSQEDLEDLVSGKLQKIALEYLQHYAKNEERRRKLHEHLLSWKEDQPIENLFESFVLEDSGISLFHLLVGFGQAHYDETAQKAVLLYPKDIMQLLLPFIRTEPFRTNFDPKGKPGRNLHIFKEYCDHPLHPIWRSQFDNRAKSIIDYIKKQYRKPENFVKDDMIYKEVKDKNLDVQAVNGSVLWPMHEDSPPSESFQVFSGFMMNRRVVLGLYYLKIVVDCESLKEWAAAKIVDLALCITSKDPAKDLSISTLRSTYHEYMGLRGSIMRPQEIKIEVPYILAEERAFLATL